MKVRLLKILRDKYTFETNGSMWFADIKHSGGIMYRTIVFTNFRNFIINHNDILGLSPKQLRKIGI